MNDFRPEVRSLFHTFKKYGFAPLYLIDEERDLINYDANNKSDFIDEIVSVDEIHVTFSTDKGNVTVYLVLGNDPGEIVCDYSFHRNVGNDVRSLVDKLTEEHADRWCGRTQPKISPAEQM
jgi:hypothetical protein